MDMNKDLMKLYPIISLRTICTTCPDLLLESNPRQLGTYWVVQSPLCHFPSPYYSTDTCKGGK